MKSPNPNDQKVIKIGKYIEQEADVLLNGKIYTDLYKLKPGSDTHNHQDIKSILTT